MPASTRRARRSASARGSDRGCSVSRLTVMRCRPARLSACGLSASSTPLVVIARSRMPWRRGQQLRPASAGRGAAAARRRSAGPCRRRASRRRPRACSISSKRQHVLARQPDVVLLRHAVLAAQVAAVGDRQAQAAQRASRNDRGRHRISSSMTSFAILLPHREPPRNLRAA